MQNSVCLGWRVPTGVQRAGRNSGQHQRREPRSEIWAFHQVPGRVERLGQAGKGLFWFRPAPPFLSMPLGPSRYTPAGWQGCLPALGQGKWEAPGQAGIEGGVKRVLEPLRLGQDPLEKLGWAFWAGGTSLFAPRCWPLF